MNQTDLTTCVGIDIGGTYTRLAVVDSFGRVAADRRTETPATRDGEDLIRWLDHAYHTCCNEADSLPAPQAVGVGVPGVLEPGRSAVIRAVNLPFIEGLALRDLLVERTGLVTVLDCDTVTAAWGEFCARDHQPTRFAYLTLGTGIGAAVIIDRAIVRHTHHSAGHLGHIVCDTSEDAPKCACGSAGCLEALISAPALTRAAAAAGIGSDLNDVELAMQEGDPQAERFIDRKARHLAVALVNLAHIYAVHCVVIGGGVAVGLPSLVHRADRLLKTAESTLISPSMRVEIGCLRDYAGVVGAALIAARHASTRTGR